MIIPMTVRINLQYIISIFIFSYLYGCSGITKKEVQNLSDIRNEEWYKFVDSSSSVVTKKNSTIDSLCLYTINNIAPSVLSKSKYIFWAKSKKVKKGDFDLIQVVDDKQFIFGVKRKRSVTINDIKLLDSTVISCDSTIFDLNSSDKPNPCMEITDVRSELLKNKLYFHLHLLDNCTDEKVEAKFLYEIR